MSNKNLSLLPSELELERSIRRLFTQQTPSGIWNKYFPLFHYEEAGSNFCFTFELLEAILCEFGGVEFKLLDNSEILEGLERAVDWCENNRLECSGPHPDTGKTIRFTGWNSGGQLETLRKNQPESWATAVVHMFLSELRTVTSRSIQRELLSKYRARMPEYTGGLNSKTCRTKQLFDINILLNGHQQSLTKLFQREFIAPRSRGLQETCSVEATIRRYPIPKANRLSALLFGPPGTSKTEIIKAMADDLNWPLIEVTPSDFVRDTLANVYARAEEIFKDLMDLAGVIVFFDEMEALVPTRDAEAVPDITSQFLTTTMLPKLARLHDQRQVLFFMATNFQERFDPAIKRAGRFDLLVCMGPPSLKEKLTRLHLVYSPTAESVQTKKAGGLIKKYLSNDRTLRDQFELFTFGDLKAFLATLGSREDLGDKIEGLGQAEFQKKLRKFGDHVGLKIHDLDVLHGLPENWKELTSLRRLTFSAEKAKELCAARNIAVPPSAVRYLCDWQQSNEQ